MFIFVSRKVCKESYSSLFLSRPPLYNLLLRKRGFADFVEIWLGGSRREREERERRERGERGEADEGGVPGTTTMLLVLHYSGTLSKGVSPPSIICNHTLFLSPLPLQWEILNQLLSLSLLPSFSHPRPNFCCHLLLLLFLLLSCATFLLRPAQFSPEVLSLSLSLSLSL